ncbi:hypothetical protein [Paenibacillus donghaensis]|nr:hypothetical protein [Paenibacillus donghaensis]
MNAKISYEGLREGLRDMNAKILYEGLREGLRDMNARFRMKDCGKDFGI